MKLFIIALSIFGASLSFGSEKCVLAANNKARKMLACELIGKPDYFIIDISSSDLNSKKFKSIKVSFQSGFEETFDFSSYTPTEYDPSTFILEWKERGSESWLKVYLRELMGYSRTIFRSPDDGALAGRGSCQFITTGSVESCFPKSKRVEPAYPEFLKFGSCNLRKYRSDEYFASYDADEPCELAPGVPVRRNESVTFDLYHPLNYPQLTYPRQFRTSQVFDHRRQ